MIQNSNLLYTSLLKHVQNQDNNCQQIVQHYNPLSQNPEGKDQEILIPDKTHTLVVEHNSSTK